MRHFYIVCTLILLILPNCGKKDACLKKKKTKKIASIENEVKDSVDSLLVSTENKSSDFSFIDEDNSFVEKDTEKLASTEFDEDNSSLSVSEEDLDESNILAENDTDFKNIEFEFNYNRIKSGQKKDIKKNIAIAKKAAADGKEIIIDGHTCQMGPASYNLSLSLKRAEAVKREMVKNGVPVDSIKIMGHGYESPLVSTDKSDRLEKIEELSQNRRAEIRIS